jgi:hypothetical protein
MCMLIRMLQYVNACKYKQLFHVSLDLYDSCNHILKIPCIYIYIYVFLVYVYIYIVVLFVHSYYIGWSTCRLPYLLVSKRYFVFKYYPLL